jgi:dihydroorotase
VRLLIEGGRVVDPSQDIDGLLEVLVEDGRIARVDEKIRRTKNTEIVDASGLVVAPGLIDMHVHLREPGQEYKETVRTGTLAAAAGGFTAVACMPNTAPPNDNRSVTEHIVTEAGRHGFAHVYPIGAVSKGQKGEEMLFYAQHFDIPVIQHAQDLDLSAGGVMHEGEWSTRLGLNGAPGSAEDVMVARDVILTEDTGGRYHVAHLSTARSLGMVRRAKAEGLAVTCEVTPHHLILTDEEVAKSGFSTNTKMNPPLRSSADREALLNGLADGTVDAIASDHAPHHADEKDVEFDQAPFGVIGVETNLSVCLDRLVRTGIIGLPRLVELFSTGPARVLELPGGTLKPDSPADITLFHPNRPITVRAAKFRSKSLNTPFEGWKLRGRPEATILGGRVVELPKA